MIVTIHQPNFMPWFPFFQKMECADIFIVLRYCQFRKNNFQNRFNLNNKWHTMSIQQGLDLIINKKYVTPIKDWNNIKKSLAAYESILNEFDNCISESHSETNTAIINKIASILKIKTKIVLDYETHLTATERLIKLCIDNGANTYLAGLSGRKYLDLTLFERENIKVVFQDESLIKRTPILEVLKKHYSEQY
ncbi:MAG: hypothetical protein FD143_2278 [Ignavibacteria bacterium]|nr:MAG: hypothetical protein FD143_2278 [Ignavibacteria bacterium]KAF0159564.1 MAG: hypothetical protein FD188_2165 [Ignavibacteria bacterium]